MVFTWILWINEDVDIVIFFYTLMPNRSKDTITEVISRYILPGKIIKTTGYAIYPVASRFLGLEHQIVSHVDGFTNASGKCNKFN